MNRLDFTYEQLPGHVVFGVGAFDKLEAEAARLKLKKLLVLSTPGQQALAAAAAERLGTRCAGIHAKAVMHVPVAVAAAACAEARRLNADGAVAIGGGSTIGLGKAIALETGL